MNIDFTYKQIQILRGAIEREQAIYSGKDAIRGRKAMLTKIQKKLGKATQIYIEEAHKK
jgi:hypothetical protein